MFFWTPFFPSNKALGFRVLFGGVVYIPFRSLMEALYTLDSPPVVAFHLRFRVEGGPKASGLGWVCEAFARV